MIVGGGEIGATLAEHLSRESKDVIVIEADEARVRELRDAADVSVVHGNGSNPEVLKAAGLDEAEMLIAVTNSDEVNIVASLVATKQSVIRTNIARVRDPDLAAAVPALFEDDPLDLNINPEEVAARNILKTLRVPGAAGVFDFADGRVQVGAFTVDQDCATVGVPLFELANKFDFDFNIVAISRRGPAFIPDGRSQIEIGDKIYAAGSPEALSELASLLGKPNVDTRRIVIAGGGNITYHLAQMLEDEEISCKIIEADAGRCKYLAERLGRSVILHGAATDPDLLREENVGSTDAFLAFTKDEEDNILAALLAKRAGAARVMALVNKPSYASLVMTIGVDAVISPNAAAVSAILHFIRKGKVVSVTTVGEEAAEALEVVALETSELVGKPLKEGGFKNAIVGAIVRGDEVHIPSGEDIIEVGDHVVIFALKSAIPDVERLMMVQLRYF